MPEPEASDEQVDQFIVYGAYGHVMHQFQVLEMTLWGFLTRGIKPGMSESQAMDRIAKMGWNHTGPGRSGLEKPAALAGGRNRVA